MTKRTSPSRKSKTSAKDGQETTTVQPAESSISAKSVTAKKAPKRSPMLNGPPADTRPAAKVDPSARHAMIAQAAYFRAEKRGFGNGSPVEDWIEAEREIAHMLDE